MEKIKQALEKVAREPGRFSNKKARGTIPVRVATDLENLRYTRSQVVELDSSHLEKHRIIAYRKDDPRGGHFDILRTKVLRRMEEQGWKTLAITSPTGGAGKTVVAINLAMAVAQQTNGTALLVDLDLRRPRVAQYLGLPSGLSINEVLTGDCGVAEALVNPSLPRLLVLPTQRAELRPAELLASDRTANLLHELRSRYPERKVILDFPPMLEADDVLAVLPQVDCVMLVIADGESTEEQIEACVRQVPAEKLLGVALNKTAVPGTDY